MSAHKASDFAPGDVVYDHDADGVLGIVTLVRSRSVDVVWEHGGASGGPGLLPCLHHHEPGVRLDVPKGALGVRYWNRQQAVAAALRKAGLR